MKPFTSKFQSIRTIFLWECFNRMTKVFNDNDGVWKTLPLLLFQWWWLWWILNGIFSAFSLDAPFTAQWFHSMFFWRISKNSKFSFHATIDRWFTVMWCDIARCIAWKEIVTINYAYETKHFFLLEQTNKEQQSTKRKCHPFAFVHSFCWLKSDNPFLHSIIEPIAFLYLKKRGTATAKWVIVQKCSI